MKRKLFFGAVFASLAAAMALAFVFVSEPTIKAQVEERGRASDDQKLDRSDKDDSNRGRSAKIERYCPVNPSEEEVAAMESDFQEKLERQAESFAPEASGGTIPERGLYGVFLGEGGPRVGELDEEMVYESRPGETFVLGASTWRIERITPQQVIVSPAPGEPGKTPFWHGDAAGRPIELGRALGEFTRKIVALDEAGKPREIAAEEQANG